MAKLTLLTVPPRILPVLAHSLLEQWREGSELVPRVVLTPSAAVGRRLLQEVARRSVAVDGLYAVTFPDLARAMALPRLDAWILPPHADRVITAHLVSEDAGPYADLALRLPVATAMARSLRDLREAGLEMLPADEILGDLGRAERFRFEHLGRIFHRFGRHLKRAGLADDAMVYSRAAEGHLPGGAEELLIYGVYDLTGVQRELLAGIAQSFRVTWLCPRLDEPSPSAELVQRIVDWAELRGFVVQELGPEDESVSKGLTGKSLDGDIKIMACPGDRAEAREVAREILAAAQDGLPFGDMAVLLSAPRRQEAYFREAFRAAGIPVTGRSESRLLGKPYGRALLAVIRLAEGRGGPEEMAAVLQARLESEPDPPLPPARVGRLLRRAGCTGLDRRRWRARLEALAKGLERARNRIGPEGDEVKARGGGAGEAAQVRALSERALSLLDRLRDFRRAMSPQRARPAWKELSHELIGLTCQLGLRASADGALFAAAEKAAQRLKGWDRLRIPPRADLALELWLERLLEVEAEETTLGERGGFEGRRVGEGVTLLGVNQARGLSMRAVWLTGLSYDLFGPQGRPDPILSDSLRARLAERYGCQLRTAGDRFRERDLLFALACAAAQERLTLSWPRLDDASGRTRHPIEPLARLIEQRSGRALDCTDPANAAGVACLPALGPRLMEDGSSRPLLSPQEYDLAAQRSGLGIRRAHLAADTRLARCLRVQRLRMGEATYNAYCGIVSPPGGGELGSLAVTALEQLARCPFRFFLAELLDLCALADANELAGPDPRELGSVAHRVLEDLFRSLEGGVAPPEAELGELLGRIDRWVSLRVKEALAQGALGHHALWKAQASRLRDALERYALVELRRLRKENLRVGRLELPMEGRLSLARGELRVRGRADRVDLGVDGTASIVDYKWSKGETLPRPDKGELFAGGRWLQLPLYARLLATMREFGEGAVGLREFRYVALRSADPTCALVVPRALLEERASELDELIGDLVGFYERGEYLPIPNGGEECRHCDFQPVCGPSDGRLAIERRKAKDPRYLRHYKLRENYP